MSVAVEDKIELFRKTIFEGIEEKSALKRETAIQAFEQEKQKLKEAIEKERCSIIKSAVEKAEKEKKQIIAKQSTEQHHILLEKQQEYMNRTIELMKAKAANFLSSSDYLEKYLKKSIENAYRDFEDSKELSFYFAENDLNIHNKFIENCFASIFKNRQYKIKKTSENIIGGFIAEDEENAIKADYTLVSVIEENKDLIGLSIAQMFDEVTY